MSAITSVSKGMKTVGKAVPGAAGIDASIVVGQVVESAFAYMTVRQQEMTKREAIRAEAEVRIEQIHASRDVFLSFIDHSFKERAYVYTELFNLLDKGIESNDPRLIDAAMMGIVSQIKQNPLGDFGKFREQLRDPNHVLEF